MTHTLGTLVLALAVFIISSAIVYCDTSDESRNKLEYEAMMSATTTDATPLLNFNFMPIGPVNSARHEFSGSITIPESAMKTIPAKIEPAMIKGKHTDLFPGVEIEFFSYKNYLVPVVRSLIDPEGSQSYWQIMVNPGRVWSEVGDHRYSRASFPFVLTNRFESETYNGLATFLYNNSNVSYLRYQIVSQMAPWLIKTRFNASGHSKIKYIPAKIKQRSELIKSFKRELEMRNPTRPWTVLVDKYDPKWLENFNAASDSESIITSGLIIDDVIYATPSRTHYGAYPYPQEMHHGVWSVSKSMLGLVSMLRLAQKYGDQVFTLKIKDYLNVTATHNGWDKVSFGDALNMATGIGYGSNNVTPNDINDGYLQDIHYNAWYLAPSAKEKLDYVFKAPNKPWGPGKYGRYRDRDYFTLAAAMDSYLKRKQGAKASLWDMINNEVYKAIGMQNMYASLTKEADNTTGVPHLGYGLYMTLDDIAKLSKLLQSGGRYKNKQLLSPTKLAEALYQTDIRGLPTFGGQDTYHMGLWHTPFKTNNGALVSIPEMRGWGGVAVTLMPNGMTAFRMGSGGFWVDSGGFRTSEMPKAANRIRRFVVEE